MMETPKEISGGPPPPPQRLRTFFQQNSDKFGRMAETVALPMNKRSFKKHEDISIDVDGKEVGATGESHPKQFPFFMTLVSLLQVVLFYTGGDSVILLFAYDPYRRHELWRYLTLLLVHASWIHLWVNIVLQVILGSILEAVHHWKRISILYICGVVGGSLAITVLDPQSYSLGASAGVYALLFAHLATIILNWSEMDKKCCRLFWLLLYIFLDVGLALYAQRFTKITTNIPYAGRIGGAVVGFIVAVLVLRNFEEHPWERRRRRRLQVILGVFTAVLFAVVVIINVAWPSRYFETQWNTNYPETFILHVLQMTGNQTDSRQLCLEDQKCRSLLMEFEHPDKISKTSF